MSKSSAQQKKHQLVIYKGGKCQDCNGTFPDCCFDFDHCDPREKSFCIAASYGKPLTILMAEVDKCDLVCANCHRIRTAANPIIAQMISEANMGHPVSTESRMKSSNSQKGQKRQPPTIEWKAQASVRAKGNKYGSGNKGKPWSEARRAAK